MRAGVIGIGDMGSGLAKNLMKNGFETTGWDIDPQRMDAFKSAGGHACGSSAEVGEHADAVFVMVMNGEQVNDVVFGDTGLVKTMKPGSAVILSATIKPAEARELGIRWISGCAKRHTDLNDINNRGFANKI